MKQDLIEYEKNMLAEITPLEATSRQLYIDAQAIAVSDDDTLRDANVLKKDINLHTKTVKEMRLELTRPIDALKATLLEREKTILEPVEQAKTELGSKILRYEDDLAAIRLKEQERIDRIAREILGHYNPGMTRTQVERAKQIGRKYVDELPPDDANLPTIKAALMTLANDLNARLQDIELDEQRARKHKLEVDQEAIDKKNAEIEARRRQIEAERLAAEKEASRLEAARPKSNIVERTEFEIVDEQEVPRAVCSPDPRKIRMAIQSGATEISGVRIFKTKAVR